MNTDLQSSDGISELVVGPQVASLQVRLRQVAEIHQVAVLKQEMSIILLTARLTGWRKTEIYMPFFIIILVWQLWKLNRPEVFGR